MEVFHFELFKYKGVIYHSYIIPGTTRRVVVHYENGKKIYPSPRFKKKLLKVHQKKFSEKKENKINFTSLFVPALAQLLTLGIVLNTAMGDVVGRTLTFVPTSTSMERLLEDALEKNDNLTDEERNFFRQYEAYLNENPYVERKNVYYNLKRFDIDYGYNYDYLELGIAGTYKPMLNKINIYDAEYEVALKNADTLGHEGFHLLSNNGDTCGCSDLGTCFGDGISEAITEILNEEYIMKKARGKIRAYPEAGFVVKFIMELVGTKPILQSYATGDIEVIVSAITSIDGKEERARKLIELVDELKDIDRYSNEYKTIKEEIYVILKSYYHMNKDSISKSKKAIFTYYLEYFRWYGTDSNYVKYYTLYRPYFNSELKQNQSHLIFLDSESWESCHEYLPDDCNNTVYMIEDIDLENGKTKVLTK